MSKTTRQLIADPSFSEDSLLLSSTEATDETYKISFEEVAQKNAPIHIDKDMQGTAGVGTITAFQQGFSNWVTFSSQADYDAINIGTKLFSTGLFPGSNKAIVVYKASGLVLHINYVIAQQLVGQNFTYSTSPFSVTDGSDIQSPVYGNKFMVTEEGVRCENINPVQGQPNLAQAITLKAINNGVGPGVTTFPTVPAGRITDSRHTTAIPPSTIVPVIRNGNFTTDYWQSFETTYNENLGVTTNPELSGLYKLRTVLYLGRNTSGSPLAHVRMNYEIDGSPEDEFSRDFAYSYSKSGMSFAFIHEITMQLPGGSSVLPTFWHDFTDPLIQNADLAGFSFPNTYFEIRFIG